MSGKVLKVLKKSAKNVEGVSEVEEKIEEFKEDVNVKGTFDQLVKSKLDLIASLKNEIQLLKKLQKDYDVSLKELSKKKKKKTQRDDSKPRKPSGFASPVEISNTLFEFLSTQDANIKKGDLVARTTVTGYITKYIKNHNLQNPENRRQIIPDETLGKLFSEPKEPKDPKNPDSEKIYTYLRLQSYITHHFPKKQVPVPAPVSA